MASSGPDAAASGPVLFAYDGSELAQLAIEQAARELAPGRDALVLCVWQPTDVGFVPVGEQHFNAQDATEVEAAAEDTAAVPLAHVNDQHSTSTRAGTGRGHGRWLAWA